MIFFFFWIVIYILGTYIFLIILINCMYTGIPRYFKIKKANFFYNCMPFSQQINTCLNKIYFSFSLFSFLFFIIYIRLNFNCKTVIFFFFVIDQLPYRLHENIWRKMDSGEKIIFHLWRKGEFYFILQENGSVWNALLINYNRLEYRYATNKKICKGGIFN